MLEEVQGLRSSVGPGEVPCNGVAGVEFGRPGVLQVEGIDHQGGGVLPEGPLDDLGDHACGMV